MTTFKKGDSVRLLRLDGTLSNPVTIHDLWGDESCDRNASFIEAGAEQFWHTDLMVLAGEHNTNPAARWPVPDGGEWFIARGNRMTWGRGKTPEEAIRNMKRVDNRTPSHYFVDAVSKWTSVDGMGGLTFPAGIEPRRISEVKNGKLVA